jgi:hypothetical protein
MISFGTDKRKSCMRFEVVTAVNVNIRAFGAVSRYFGR